MKIKTSSMGIITALTGCALAITAIVVYATTGNKDAAGALTAASWIPTTASIVLSYRYGR